MPEKISEEIVEQTWLRMAQITPDEAPDISSQMIEEQPYVMVYLTAIGGDMYLPHEQEILFYVGMVLWQIMRQSPGQLQQVDEKTLEKAEELNYDMMDQLEDVDDKDFTMTVSAMIDTYPEPEVLRYALDAVMEDEEDEESGPPIRDEYRGMAFMHLKIVLDAMIASLAQPHEGFN